MNLNIDRETYDKMSDTEKTSFFKQLHDKHTNDVLARGGGKIIMSLTYGGVPLYEDIESIIEMIKEYK